MQKRAHVQCLVVWQKGSGPVEAAGSTAGGGLWGGRGVVPSMVEPQVNTDVVKVASAHTGGITWKVPGGFGEGEIYRVLEFVHEQLGNGASLTALQVAKLS